MVETTWIRRNLIHDFDRKKYTSHNRDKAGLIEISESRIWQILVRNLDFDDFRKMADLRFFRDFFGVEIGVCRISDLDFGDSSFKYVTSCPLIRRFFDSDRQFFDFRMSWHSFRKSANLIPDFRSTKDLILKWHWDYQIWPYVTRTESNFRCK